VFDPQRYRPAGAAAQLVRRIQQLDKPAVIGIDGPGGVGKTALGTWLGVETGCHFYDCDDALPGDGRLWDVSVIRRVIASRRPEKLILAGSCLLDLLEHKPELLVVLAVSDNGEYTSNGRLRRHIAAYEQRMLHRRDGAIHLTRY